MKYPAPETAMPARKATRQPQLFNASVSRLLLSKDPTAEPSRMPPVAPNMLQQV